MRAARRQAEVPASKPPMASLPPTASESVAIAADLPPVVQAGPNGCTERVTCRGRAGKDGRCAAHKAKPDVPAQDG